MLGTPVIRKIPQSKDGSRAEPDDLQAAIKAALSLPPDNLTPAPFLGNFTVVSASSGNGLILARQADCSLGAGNVPYSTNVGAPYQPPVSEVDHYDQLLHAQAGLTTKGGVFASGCTDKTVGIVSNNLLYAGKSTGGQRMAAVAAYNSTVQNNVLYTFVIKDDGTYVGSVQQSLPSPNAPFGVAAADLNGDGNPDLVAVGYTQVSGTNTSNAAITILLGKADGTFAVGKTYATGNGFTDSVVIDDFNGDGKLDVVVPAGGLTSAFGRDGTLVFLPGNGDGTFGAAKTLDLPSGAESFASGDLNGDGKKDLVSGTGIVLLGNGDGTFKLQTTPAFPMLKTNSSAVAQVALADFNHDGKLDIAAGTGADIHLYLGNGDGTFAVGNVYAGIDNSGYLAATDIDGDGNIDLFSGNAQGGIFTGDAFSPNKGYALMGVGDGSFRGAPVIYAASFNAMEDLNGDKNLDFIGISGNDILTSKPFFGTYIGRGDGTFQPKGASLSANFTSSGTAYTVANVDSYVTADLNGDGRPDLLYLPSQYFSNSPLRAGFAYALANADGSFQAPVFFPARPLDSGEEGTPTLANLRSAINKDGRLEISYAYKEATFVSGTASTRFTSGYVTQVSNGDGTFTAPAVTVIATGNGSTGGPETVLPATALAFADLNGDKIPDMAVYTPNVFASGGVITSPSMLKVMIGKADGTFGTATIVPVVGSPVDSSFALGDLNGDGIPDIAIEGSTSSGNSLTPMIGIALGKGDGTFNVQTPLKAGSDFEALSIGDYNGDGKADLAMASFSQISLNGVFPGNGDGTFQTVASGSGNGSVVPPLKLELYNSGGAGTPAAGYDINGDGKLDLIAGDTVLLQSSVPAVSLTSTATALVATPASVAVGGTVTLTATVTATGGGTPAGSISFLDGSTNLGTMTLDGTGKATLSTSSLAVGTQTLIASYSGSGIFAASSSSPSTVSVTAAAPATSAAALSASVSSATVGASVTFTAKVSGPAGSTTVPTGNVTFFSGSVNLGSTALNASAIATFTTTQLPLGANSITAQYAGDASYTASTSNVVLVAISAPSSASSTTTLSASTTSATVGQSVSFTAKVAAPSGNSTVPTGTVNFLAGTTSLGTGTLSGGVATLVTTTLPVGTASVTAVYGGDANFAGSTSTAVSVSVTGATGDFALTLSPASASVSAGSGAMTSVFVQPTGGFSGTVSFTCSGLPAHSTCSFAPATVAPSGNAAATTQLTVATNVATAALAPTEKDAGGPMLALAATFLGLVRLARSHRKSLRGGNSVSMLILAFALAVMAGCGGGSSKTPTGLTNVTVIATSGSTSHTATFALTVQ